MKNEKELMDFLREQRISFEVMIRCYLFWQGLSVEEQYNFMKKYEKGKIPSCGHYGYSVGFLSNTKGGGGRHEPPHV